MGWDYLGLGLLATLALLLVSVGVQDARTREIDNWKNGAIALLAPAWWYAIGLPLWPDAVLQLGAAAIIFGLFVGAFALGQMGGGDVKLIGALALWLPLQPMMTMLIVMSLVGGGLTIVMLIEKKLKKNEGILEVPYGVAIAIAGLLSLREPLLNQFT